MQRHTTCMKTIQCKNVNYIAKRDVCTDGLYWEHDIRTDRATFGMGCFWSPEAIFGLVPGVIRTRVGYAGGTKMNPTCNQLYDHSKVVDMEYDPLKVCYEKLLDIFWQNHDSSIVCPRKHQSIIFYHTSIQRDLAENTFRQEISNRSQTVKTRIYPAKEFYEAEDVNQKHFLQKYPYVLACMDIQVGMPLIRSKVAARLNGYVGGFAPIGCFEAEWKNLGLCCEVVEFIRKVINHNYRKKIGCY